MDRRGIKAEIRLQVIKNLDYLQRQENEKPDKALQILNTVSEKIKNQVYINFYGRILNQTMIFKQNFSDKFLESLALIMKEKIYGPGEIIYNQFDKDQKIFFIVEGEVQLLHENGNLTQSEVIQCLRVSARARYRIKRI